MDLSGIVLVQPAASADQCGLQDPAMPFLDLPSETRVALVAYEVASSLTFHSVDFLHRPGSDLAQNTNSFAHITSASNLA
jgi:hypothetical protein